MLKWFISLFLVSTLTSVYACEKLSFGNTAHVQTWLTLLVTKDIGKTPFVKVGGVKVSDLKSLAEVQSIELTSDQIQKKIEFLAEEMHQYISKHWSIQSSDEIAKAIENQLQAKGTVCDLANELDQLRIFESKSL